MSINRTVFKYPFKCSMCVICTNPPLLLKTEKQKSVHLKEIINGETFNAPSNCTGFDML